MRLKTLFLVANGLFSVVAVVAALAIVLHEWQRADAAHEAAAAVAALRPALDLSERLALERGGYNEDLLAAAPAGPPALRTLAALKARTDDAFARTVAALRTAHYAEAPQHLVELARVRDDLARLRARATAEIAGPRAGRDPAFVTGYAPQIFDLTARVTTLQAGMEMAASRADPAIGQYAAVARVMGLVRDFAGRKQTLYVQILAGETGGADMTRRLGDADGRIEVYWTRALTLIDMAGEPGLVAAAKAVQRAYFDANAPVYARIRAAHPPSAGWPGDVASFRAWGIPTLQSILRLRDAAFEVAAERSATEARGALVDLVGALVASMLMAAAAAGFMLYFARRVIYPLSNLEAAVARIADGDLAALVPETARGNELGRVARALDTLRLSLIAAGGQRDDHERALQEAKIAAEAASRAKSEFLANMSHELRTPLNAVLGFSDIIRGAVVGPVDARYRDYAEDINKAGQHLLSLINDVLDLSKVEVGHLELREELVDLPELIQACERIVAARAREAGLDLVLDLPPGALALRADERRLKQIVLNLMSNAVKFTARGGRVTVAAATLPGGETVITVADTGIGMTQDEVSIALQPFRQLDSALNRRFEGTGLGLPLAKNLVELHGGTLAVESVSGRGTTVTVTLPAERACGAMGAAWEAAWSEGAGPH